MADFVWRVSRSGYEWGATDTWGRLRSGVLATETGRGFREYRPLAEEPLLFRRFADLGTDPKDYLGFAGQYGHLTSGVSVIDRDGNLVEDDFAERLRSPRDMPDELGLQTHVEVADGVEDQWVWQAHVAKMKSLIRAWERDRARRDGVGRTAYGREIVANLLLRVVPCFDDTGALSHMPTNLLSALWLQLARAVGGNRVHRQCPTCWEWFEVSAPEPCRTRRTRSDKVYCGDTCRMEAAYRRTSAGRGRAYGKRPAKKARRAR